MRIRVDEHLTNDGENVAVILHLGAGRDEPVLAGLITCDLDTWLELLRRIEHPYYTVERGPCPTCQHKGHLGDVCLAATVVDGEDRACECGLDADEPIVYTLTPDQVAHLQVVRERNAEFAADDSRDNECLRMGLL